VQNHLGGYGRLGLNPPNVLLCSPKTAQDFPENTKKKFYRLSNSLASPSLHGQQILVAMQVTNEN